MSWRSYARKLGVPVKPDKPRRIIIKKSEMDAWMKRQQRQALFGLAVIAVLASVVAVLILEGLWMAVR